MPSIRFQFPFLLYFRLHFFGKIDTFIFWNVYQQTVAITFRATSQYNDVPDENLNNDHSPYSLSLASSYPPLSSLRQRSIWGHSLDLACWSRVHSPNWPGRDTSFPVWGCRWCVMCVTRRLPLSMPRHRQFASRSCIRWSCYRHHSSIPSMKASMIVDWYWMRWACRQGGRVCLWLYKSWH